jgi:stress-induced morphogen
MSSARFHVSAAAVQARLQQALAPDSLDVIDDSAAHAGHAGAREGSHLTVRIVSARFAGLPRVARHRLVYDAEHFDAACTTRWPSMPARPMSLTT